jgi:hypothetical protein
MKILAASWRINKSFPFVFFFGGKTTFLYRDKDRTLTYRRLTSFVASFVYLWFLDTRLSLGSSLFPISLVLRYRVTFRSMFYQTWFLAFQVVIYFVGGSLTKWSRGSHQTIVRKITQFKESWMISIICESQVSFVNQTTPRKVTNSD